MQTKSSGWVVVQKCYPLGYAVDAYLAQPRKPLQELKQILSGGWVFHLWDEEHDAYVFESWFAAAYQALLYAPWARVRRRG